ncbi:Zinc finger protein GLIS2 [Psilocybe cubensis]|uniref:C2H2-type domain-containing protein n=2 Tax=Psilocybe cubensis TaxID=181762 RepID=A0A8H7XVW7_PSICU|nr:Zinc finger protein GLIS2 [Psilocybe cubensis]KAH9479459.1 Zinc finger protein GLIS2 [Psilocybe cubensis]
MAHNPLVRSTSRLYGTSGVVCAGCTGPDTDCSDPLCGPSSELTSQCTDQCVVIACSDPNHEESICDRDGAHTHCDLICDEDVECTDCHGFDAFLRCCDDYHPYQQEPPRFQPQVASTTPAIIWDSTFENLSIWCGHHMVDMAKPMAHDRQIDSYAPPEPENSGAKSLNSFEPRAPYASEQSTFQPESFSGSPPPQDLVNCLWDSCQDTFSSISELAGHVNTHIPTLQDNSWNQTFNQTMSQNQLPCLWAECDSSYHLSPNDIELLASHVLNDHIGVSFPSRLRPSSSRLPSPYPPPSSVPQTMLNPKTENIRLAKSKSPSPASTVASTTQHSCNDIHECRWKNCGEIFGSCDDLTAHITSVHIGGGKAHYECFWDQCTRNGSHGFQSKQKICRHVQSHTGHRPFQCTICQQNFSEAATLQQHIRRHTQEKPYVCDHPGCGKSFAITGALTIHKRTHNGDKPFKCTFCDRGFAESSNLSKHLRTHTGARPYTCMEPGCNKSFARPDQLNRHKGVHRKQLRGIIQTTLE